LGEEAKYLFANNDESDVSFQVTQEEVILFLKRTRTVFEKNQEPLDTDPLDYWKKQKNVQQYSSIIQMMLAIPATTAETERSFSSTGFLCDGRENMSLVEIEKSAIVRALLKKTDYSLNKIDYPMGMNGKPKTFVPCRALCEILCFHVIIDQLIREISHVNPVFVGDRDWEFENPTPLSFPLGKGGFLAFMGISIQGPTPPRPCSSGANNSLAMSLIGLDPSVSIRYFRFTFFTPITSYANV